MILYNSTEHITRPTSWKIAMIFFFAIFCFGLPNLNAQQTLNISSTSQIFAEKLDVKAYPNGTFDADKAFLTFATEMDKMNNDFSRSLKYRYYWLISVDMKRNGYPLEESLLKNLNKVGREYGVPNSTLQKLYQKTIALL